MYGINRKEAFSIFGALAFGMFIGYFLPRIWTRKQNTPLSDNQPPAPQLPAPQIGLNGEFTNFSAFAAVCPPGHRFIFNPGSQKWYQVKNHGRLSIDATHPNAGGANEPCYTAHNINGQQALSAFSMETGKQVYAFEGIDITMKKVKN